jgi:hypothetical protein
MADNSNRWQRIADNPEGKQVFTARQTTDAFRRPAGEPARKARRRSQSPSAKIWWRIGIALLSILVCLLVWQLFFS